MRFVAQWFVKLLERYLFLETSAFLVIGILGLKLFLALPCHFYHEAPLARWIEGETADLIVSMITASFFFVPILSSRFLGWPKYNAAVTEKPAFDNRQDILDKPERITRDIS
jgi:predicted tellurium resistance membrane protein TerC